MKTRIFAAFLSLLLAVSLLAGCNTQPVPTETQASRQLFQVDITADAPDLARVSLDASVPLAEVPGARLTSAEAIVIALEKAGLMQEQVTDLIAEFDEGKYEVEFSYDGWEYDYEIHAETGEVLKAEKEPEKD